MSEISRINISTLKMYKGNFENEKDNFKNSSYATFSSSYLSSSSDSTVNIMKSRLDEIYKSIDNGYNKIFTWFDNYTQDVDGIENVLSNDGRTGSITESLIRNYVNSNLEQLPDYLTNFTTFPIEKIGTFDFAIGAAMETANSNIETLNLVGNKINDFFDDVQDVFAKTQATVQKQVTAAWNSISKQWENVILPFLVDVGLTIMEVCDRVNATVGTFIISLVEGILQFGEAIVDFVAILGTALASIVTGIIDGCQALDGWIRGTEWSSVTKQMWQEGTMAFVSNQYVTGWFDSFYQNTEIGKYFSEKSYGFDTTRSIGSGIGYIAGVTVLTFCTFGVGGAVAGSGAAATTTATATTFGVTAGQTAIVASAGGFGKGAEKAWGEGASLFEGLGYATLSGIWEGIQYFVGAKIGTSKMFLPKDTAATVGSKFLNSISKIILDSIDGGIEGIVQPSLQLTYKDGFIDDDGNYVEFSNENSIPVNLWNNFCELFDDNGGWVAVGTNATIAAGGSFLGEVFDVSKYFENSKNPDIEISSETRTAISELDDAYSEKQLDGIIDSLISKEKGVNGSIAGTKLFRQLDYDVVPKLVTPDEFLKLSNSSTYGLIYRGISGEDAIKYMDQFKNGEMYVGGGNARLRGTGIYTAYGDSAFENVAQAYASNGGMSQNGIVMNMLLSEDAKIIDFDSIQSEQSEVLDMMSKSFKKYSSTITNFDTLTNNLDKITDSVDLKKAQYIVNVLSDPGYYASLRGFDAIDVVDKKYLVICNRGKIIMQADTVLDYIKHIDDFSNTGVNFDNILSLKTDELSIMLKSLDDSTLRKLISRVNESDNLKFILDNIEDSKLGNIIGQVADTNISKITSNLDGQIALANYNASKGRSSIITVDSLDDIPADFWSKINDPSSVQFKVGDQVYSYADAKWRPEINNIPSNLDEQIELANYYTGKGNFYTITVDSLDDLTLEQLSKLTDSDNVIFRLNDGNTYNADQISNMLKNEVGLKNEILNLVDGIYDPIARIRVLYEELNKRLHYSMDYIVGDQSIRDGFMDQNITFASLGSNRNVVCKGWSQLFKELLVDAGFDDADIKIQGVKHNWVEIDLKDGNILLADATDAINNSIDLFTSKAGSSTVGFMIVDGSLTGCKPKTIIEDGKYTQILQQQQEWLKSLDTALGYADKNGYLIDQISKTKDLFSNSKLLSELLGINTLSKKMEKIFNVDIPNGMDGYEAWVYFKKISDNILGTDSNRMGNIFLYNQTPTMVEPINVISYLDDNSVMHYQLYSESTGKINIIGIDNYNAYISNLNLINKR